MANKSIPRIEGILQFYTPALGADYNAYRNHVYRVYHLTLLLNTEEPTPEEQAALAIAAAFHDLGIWSNHTMDYLQPSTDLAKAYLSENHSDILTPLVHDLIVTHHKISSYQGANQSLIEAFRKADLMDLSFGTIRHGLPRSRYIHLREEFPFLNFQKTVFKKIMRYAIGHLNRPFPMLKR
ncbi:MULTISPECIES: hypothetical protein [Reichenbachiella]|uniref:HD domain-containing protein n=1 Tax=Reichenbachiella agariperforans TaxID=156994 RepID=A0A1M6V6T9_REIAG|nr:MULTISPECIES: hypothetical protein [Reichenbachiella]MBU2912892.1 hypothetical protein [Reichenbachiella agariperforans]RJE72797.1 hypothetical protein BGP76_02265 [Reichenbachiella sp. MSK19-1]SHK77150.1 hypothetical protein SAMN04488028_108141 [Reichenbachiella agariperforans]